MDSIKIVGGNKLNGIVKIGGAKNAALPILCCSLLSNEQLILSNIPQLEDINNQLQLLSYVGVKNKRELEKNSITLQLDRNNIRFDAPYDLIQKMRTSILVLGPLLAHHRKAKISLPGGCAIGARPVDLHIKAMEQLGAKITLENGYIEAHCPNGLSGTEIRFPMVSVGATENAIMASTLASGTTTIHNAALEPEVVDLCNCLNQMGAKISNHGTNVIKIEGVKHLQGTTYNILPDRIEAGTYAIAAAITRGNITLEKCHADIMESTISLLRKCNITVEVQQDNIVVSAINKTITACDIETNPYPCFPTDMQAQYMALMLTAQNRCKIIENIFENRFMHVPELQRLGADITIKRNKAIVNGSRKLKGAQVMATDLRASSSLILAGLVAEGTTIVNNVYHLDRGYEKLEEKLAQCGANIQRVKSSSHLIKSTLYRKTDK